MVSRGVILDIYHLSKQFGKFAALSDVTFKVLQNEIIVVLGPSGSGKTVLLRSIAGLEPISCGSIKFYSDGDCLNGIVINGELAHPRSAFGKISMVFQDLNLWPHLSVKDNLTEALKKTKGMSVKEAEKEIIEIVEYLEIGDQLNKYPRELSVGQQQRVAIGRSLAIKPEILLLDEITSALDPERTRNIASIIESLGKSLITMILVTHNMSLAKKIGDRFLFICNGKLTHENGLTLDELIASRDDRLSDYLRAAEL